MHFGDTLAFDLGAYEQLVAEIRPQSAHPSALDGVRYSVRNGVVRVYAPPPAAPALAFTPPALQTTGAAGQPRTIRASLSVEVPADYREARLAFLLEPEGDVRDVKADATDNARPITVTLENGGRGAWHWFFTNLAAGRHELELTFHVPAAPGEIHFSGWLLTRRALAAQELHISAPPEDLLPASSEVQRATHSLVETSIR